MQPFFGPPFSSMPMQAPLQGMSQAGTMFSGVPMQSAMTGLGGQAMRGGGGFLSRLLGGLGGGLGGAPTAASGPMMGGLSSAASGGVNLANMLTNAQKVLGLTQQVLPMIHQYGPLIRNAPAILKIMRSNNSTDESSSFNTDEPETSVNATSEPIHTSEWNNNEVETTHIPIAEVTESEPIDSVTNSQRNISRQKSGTMFKPKKVDGIPLPKLYV